MKRISILVRKVLYRCADALSHGDDALMLAAYYGRIDMVRYLLSLKKRVPCDELFTHAVGGGHLEMVRYLLSCYELENPTMDIGNVLEYTIKIGNHEITALLQDYIHN